MYLVAEIAVHHITSHVAAVGLLFQTPHAAAAPSPHMSPQGTPSGSMVSASLVTEFSHSGAIIAVAVNVPRLGADFVLGLPSL